MYIEMTDQYLQHFIYSVSYGQYALETAQNICSQKLIKGVALPHSFIQQLKHIYYPQGKKRPHFTPTDKI